MGADSKIEWTDHTFNCVWGCVEVSPACDNCYARTLDKVYGKGQHWGAHAPFRLFGEKHWTEPLKWNRDAARDGVRRRVFCSSMADVFDNRWPVDIRARLFRLIRDTPNLTWMLLTKRPQNMGALLPPDWDEGYENVWLGATTENKEEAERRLRYLLATPARIRFVSYEPALGPVDHFGGVDWIIAGGESGPKARPAHPDWFRRARDIAASTGAAFFFKQWGEFAPAHEGDSEIDTLPMVSEETDRSRDRVIDMRGNVDCTNWSGPDQVRPFALMRREGKKAAGRLLDGREHSEFPSG